MPDGGGLGGNIVFTTLLFAVASPFTFCYYWSMSTTVSNSAWIRQRTFGMLCCESPAWLICVSAEVIVDRSILSHAVHGHCEGRPCRILLRVNAV